MTIKWIIGKDFRIVSLMFEICIIDTYRNRQLTKASINLLSQKQNA